MPSEFLTNYVNSRLERKFDLYYYDGLANQGKCRYFLDTRLYSASHGEVEVA